MADVSDPTLAAWAAEVKDDANPVSWLLYGYSGKAKIAPRVKGTGEAVSGFSQSALQQLLAITPRLFFSHHCSCPQETYWEEFRSHLVDDEILFGLVRVVSSHATLPVACGCAGLL